MRSVFPVRLWPNGRVCDFGPKLSCSDDGRGNSPAGAGLSPSYPPGCSVSSLPEVEQVLKEYQVEGALSVSWSFRRQTSYAGHFIQKSPIP